MEDFDPKEYLLFALNHFNLPLKQADGKMVYLEHDYAIEIESKRLFKLLHQGQVIAPFDDVEELCHFIQSDLDQK